MNPFSQLVLKVTDLVVMPLTRLFPPQAKLDWASLSAAVLIAALLATIRFLMVSLAPDQSFAGPVVRPFGLVFILAVIWLAGWTIKLAVVLVLAQAFFSWFSSNRTAATLRPVLTVLVAPMVKPIQKRLPRTSSGLDFSPIVLFIGLQLLLSAQSWMESEVLLALFP